MSKNKLTNQALVSAGPFKTPSRIEKCNCHDGIQRVATMFPVYTVRPEFTNELPGYVRVKNRRVKGKICFDSVNGYHFIPN